MPQRPKQHLVDEHAQQIFKAAIPKSWVAHNLSPDYAKDYLVEIGEGGDVSGKFFVVQLKGKSAAQVRKRDQTITVPIKREHLRYYIDIKQLPVFIVAADTVSEQAYFEFAQKVVNENPELLSKKIGGRATFSVPLANKVSDSAHFLAEIGRSWAFMREKYPGSIQAALKSRKELLEGIDPRFALEISVHNGKEHIQLNPKNESVKCTMSISGPAKVVKKKVNALWQKGIPLTADSEVSITMDGSPLFEELGKEISTFSMERTVPLEVGLFVGREQSARVSFPQFRGPLNGGLTHQKFRGQLQACPLRIGLTIRWNKKKLNHPDITMHWDWSVSEWGGQLITFLPWFDDLHSFLKALLQPGAVMGMSISSNGCKIAEGMMNEPLHASLISLARFTELIEKAREICRTLNITPRLPTKWNETHIRDINELHSLVTTGRYTFPRTFNLRVTFNGLVDRKHFEDPVPTPLLMKPISDKYTFFDSAIDFLEVGQELSNWESFEIEETVRDGEHESELTLKECTRAYVWDRFIKA